MLDTLSILQSENSPFCEFSNDFFAELNGQLKEFRFRKKQFIYREGFPPTGFFLVLKGKVKVVKGSASGKEVIVFIARDNDLLGYHSLISETDYITSACAIEETEVLFFPKELFNTLYDKYPEFSKMISRKIITEFERVVEKLIDVTSKQVRKRVAEMILRMMDKHGTEKDKKTLSIILLREDMAHLVSTTTETLVRILSDMKKDKLIDFNGKKISVINKKELLKVSSRY